MIIVQNYVCQSELYVTTLNHEQVFDLFFGEKCSAAYPNYDSSKDKTHWIAEPSVIRNMDAFCKEHGHLFKKANFGTCWGKNGYINTKRAWI